MDKYTYHHYHPKLTNELFSERDNNSIHFYSRNRGARITKSSHFRFCRLKSYFTFDQLIFIERCFNWEEKLVWFVLLKENQGKV